MTCSISKILNIAIQSTNVAIDGHLYQFIIGVLYIPQTHVKVFLFNFYCTINISIYLKKHISKTNP